MEGNFTNNIPCEAKNITKYMFNSQSLLFDDLSNELALKTVLSIRKVLDDVTDDEITNFFIMNTHSFLHPINYLLSPAALSVSFFNSQLLNTKKLYKDEYYYSKSSLPSVTYLNISGIYSEIDIDILHEFSGNIQTIMIYDENTGGPSILSKGEYKEEIDGRKNPRGFQTISDKLLLIPLRCDKKRKEKSYSQNDILSIIEQMVVGAIAKFKPSYVVLNCSLIHDGQSNTPFCIDGNTLGKILQLISVLCDQKVVVYPFKLPNLAGGNNQKILKRSARYDYIFEKYAIPYQPKFLLDCFVNCIEALAGLKEENAWERATMRRLAGENPLRSQVLYLIGRHYKNHPYYNFLYSKTLAPLAVSSRKYIGAEVSVPSNKAKPISYLPFIVLGGIETKKLEAEKRRMNEVILEENSQYLVDYGSDKSNPTVYVFNARLAESACGITTYGRVCHAAFRIDIENPATFREHFELEEFDVDEDMMRKDFGLCKCGSLVFQVYGTDATNNKDSTDIFYFDIESSKDYKLEIKGEKPEILPRHGVTVCAFQREGRYYLYVFGGQVQNDVVYGNRRLGSLDVIDIVEVYSIEDPRGKAGWDYKVLQKAELTKDERISFIPFRNSFAFYDEKREEILLMGGSQFVNSVCEWNFPVFVFDVKAGKFTKFDMFLNDAKGNLQRKTIINEPDAIPVLPMAIADQNKNFFYDAKNDTFEFLVMNRFNKIGCKYSYRRETNECDFTQALLQLDDDDGKLRFAPPTLNRTENSEKLPPIPIEISKKLSFFLTSLNRKKFLLKMIVWRMKIQKEVISQEELRDYLTHKKTKVAVNEADEIGQVKLEEQMNQTDKLFQSELIQTLFLKKSPELAAVKKYLLSDYDWITMQKIKYEMKYEQNSTQEDYPLDKTNPLNVARLDITPQSQTSELDSQSSSNKVDEMSMSFSKAPSASNNSSSSTSFVVLEGRKKKDESGSGSAAEESKNKDYSIIETSKALQQSYSRIVEGSANFVAESLKKKSDSGESNSAVEESKSKSYSVIDTSRILQQSYSHIVAGHAGLDNFKECLATTMNSRVFINKAKNGIIFVKDENHSAVCQNLLFKVHIKDELEEISFSLSPSSVTVFRGVIVCYIDQQFKITHPHLYQEYKNWILYADLKNLAALSSSSNTIVFEKLIQLTTDDHIYNRSILINEQSLFLFGGKSVKYKGNQRVVYHKNLSRYDLKKFTDLNQRASTIRDTDIDDEMENSKGECTVIYAWNSIFVCQKNSPQNIEIFQEDGVIEESLDLGIDTKGYTAFMNHVSFEERPYILVTLCKIDEDMKFVLYDILERVLVTENVTIVPRDEEVVHHPLFYSGFEEIEVSITGDFKNEVLIYNYRGDVPKIIPYIVKM